MNSLTQQQNEKLDKTNERLESNLREVNNKLIEQNKALNEQLSKANFSNLKQFEVSQKALSDYAEKLKTLSQEITKVSETGKDIKTFAQQLQSFENILKNPKQRGILGEYFLETVLKNVLPSNSFQMQFGLGRDEYTGKDLIVDAAIFVGEKIIPIDAKFSLENYNKIVEEDDPVEKIRLEKLFKQDLINRIDETSKYIRPEKNTMEFAFMFIPSEGVYYDILVNKSGNVKIETDKLIDEAFKKKVLIVSPTNLLAYLQTVLQGLRALKIEESAKQIRENVGKLSKHLEAYQKNFDKLGKNLGTVVTAYNDAHKEFKKIDKDVMNISGESVNVISDEVEKPLTFDE
jgi:DNA recombination protein RmuC